MWRVVITDWYIEVIRYVVDDSGIWTLWQLVGELMEFANVWSMCSEKFPYPESLKTSYQLPTPNMSHISLYYQQRLPTT